MPRRKTRRRASATGPSWRRFFTMAYGVKNCAACGCSGLQSRQGVPHLRVLGKESKVRYVPAHPLALERIHDYLQAAGHGEDVEGPLFQPLKNPAGQGKTD